MIARHEVVDSREASQLGVVGEGLHINNNNNKTNLTFLCWLELLAIELPSVLS